MSTYTEWRAVGIDVENGEPQREEGRWHATKAEARDDVDKMKSETISYDRVIVELRTVSLPVQVSA